MADKGEDDGVSLNDGGFESSVKWRFGFSRRVAVLKVFRGELFPGERWKEVKKFTVFPAPSFSVKLRILRASSFENRYYYHLKTKQLNTIQY